MSQDNARRRRWPMVTGVVAVTLAGAGLAGIQLAAAATTGCRVGYTVTNQWPGGFGANVDVSNLGDAGQRVAGDVDVRGRADRRAAVERRGRRSPAARSP